ncbi:recombinase family protein [Micromonospora sp. NPDC050200]|uniref:recombinase family protein n=1 Tax=Micromonospora sp. NPDC050200 TaxID=3155664 RepID=UPI0033FBEF61
MKPTVGILVRISDDREDERKGVKRQEQDCRELADRLGWLVGEVYTENDTSAFKRRKITLPNGKKAMRVIRPEFRRMLEDLEAGRIQGLIAYDLDRAMRDPRDLEDLNDVVEMTRPRPVIRSVTGSLQLDTDADLTNARVLVAMANKSSRDTARRVARAARERAERGKWHGGTPAFGFVAVKELLNGRERVVTLRPHPDHAAWVREAMERLLAGESLYGICTDWNRQGRRTGWKRRDHRSEEVTTWYPRTLKRIVTAPAVAAYREYDGQLYPAVWEPIVDRDDWQRVCTLLAAPERKLRGFNNGNARKYALSGLVFCAECRHVMVSMTATRVIRGERVRRVSFVCNQLATGGCGSMRIETEHLERYIFAQVFIRADSPALRAAMSAQADDIDEAEQALHKSIVDGERRLERVEDEYDAEEITKVEYRRRRAKIMQQLEAHRALLAKATRSRVHTRLPSGAELRAVWPDKDNTWKRTIVASVIERIEVSRHPAGVASNLTARRDEGPEVFSQRRDLHRAQVLRQRVEVQWWV